MSLSYGEEKENAIKPIKEKMLHVRLTLIDIPLKT
jgi:hypothetical protein